MKLKAVRIEKKLIPEWMGNRELPANEQLVIHFSRIPGTSEKKNYIEYSSNAKGQVSISYNDNMLVATFVTKIENLEIEFSGVMEKIKTGSDLATVSHPALEKLFSEIRDYLFPVDEELTEGE